jgi:lysozyme
MKALREIGEYIREQERKKMGYSELIREIKDDEGYRNMAYKCSEGYLTIGYGTKLPLSDVEKTLVKDSENVNEAEAELLLSFRLEKSINELKKAKGWVIDTLTPKRREVIFNMLYQLGHINLLAFKKMWVALEAGNFHKAADEMKDSKWYNQTPVRAKRLVNKMLEG